MASEHLVTAAWLAERLRDPDLVVADVRWSLATGSDRRAYLAGHIPGARFVDLDAELAAPPGPGRPGRHPLPSPERFAETLARLGVTPRSTVVAYDDMGGAVAARLWWMLRWVGHSGGRVLDGGLQAWQAAGLPLATDEPSPAAAEPMPLRGDPSLLVDADEVEVLRHRPGTVLLDARAAERYRGEIEPIDPRAGHIPGARSAPLTEHLEAPQGRFRPPADLAGRYRQLGVDRADAVIAYCGSGVTACHTLLALAVAGFEGAKLYQGSWSDWSSQPERPAATGPEPLASEKDGHAV